MKSLIVLLLPLMVLTLAIVGHHLLFDPMTDELKKIGAYANFAARINFLQIYYILVAFFVVVGTTYSCYRISLIRRNAGRLIDPDFVYRHSGGMTEEEMEAHAQAKRQLS